MTDFSKLNYYERLGVSENANLEEIKKAYRNAMRQYHPDVIDNNNPEERKSALEAAQYISEAYNVLKNPERRALYDGTLRNFSTFSSKKTNQQKQEKGYQEKKADNKNPKDTKFEVYYKNQEAKANSKLIKNAQKEVSDLKKVERKILNLKIIYPTSRALIASNILENINFLDPHELIAQTKLLVNLQDKGSSVLFEETKTPVREIDPSGNPIKQQYLDYKYQKDFYKNQEIIENQYQAAINLLRKIVSAEYEKQIELNIPIQIPIQLQPQHDQKKPKNEEEKTSNQSKKQESKKDKVKYLPDYSSFNYQDAEIVRNNPGWLGKTKSLEEKKQDQNVEYFVPSKLKTISPTNLLEDRQKRIEEETRHLIDSIATGEQGKDLLNQFNSDPEGVRKKVLAFVTAEQLSHFAHIYPVAANFLARSHQEVREAVRRRDLLISQIQNSGLYDPKNPIPFDPSIDSYTGFYEIGKKAWENFGRKNGYEIPTDNQISQSAISARALDIINFFEANNSLLERFPQLQGFYQKAINIKGIFSDTTKKLKLEALKKGTKLITRGASTQILKSAFVKGTASLLAKAGAALASGGTSLLISLAPEIIKILKDPIGSIKKIGGFLMKASLALIGILTLLLMSVIAQLVIIFIITIIGLVSFAALALFVINSSGFVVPQAEELRIQRDSPNQSAAIRVSKSSSSGNNIQNPNGNTTIEYTIEISANENLSDILFNNSYTISQSSQPQTQTIQILSPQITIPNTINSGSTYRTSYSITIDNRYANSRICDTFTISATVNGGPRETASETYCISVGNAPAISDCYGPNPTSIPDPNTIPTATGILFGTYQGRRYAFPVAPFAGSTEGFSGGNCVHWDGNRSVDIFPPGVYSDESPPARAPIVAYTDGKIKWVRNDAIGGKNLAIEGDDGGYFYYAHFCNIFVIEGQRVVAGQVLGTTDRTGTAGKKGSPEHLHFAINRNSPTYSPGGCFKSGDGNVCPSTEFNRTLQGYNRCEKEGQQCPNSREIPKDGSPCPNLPFP